MPHPLRFFSVFTSLLTFKSKDVFEAAAEVTGLVLAYMEKNQQVRLRLSLFAVNGHPLHIATH